MSIVDSGAKGLLYLSRAVFEARRLLSSSADKGAPPSASPPRKGARNILFVTVDQQRHDALGCAGNRVTATPHVDALAAEGIRYEHAIVQNVVCMPSRSTMLTGQYPYTHGVIGNGIRLPEDVPNVAALLAGAGYRTSLIGKAHFDPHLDPLLSFSENRLAAERSNGPWRGFQHVELATHGPLGGHHYAAWLWQHHREDVSGFGAVLTGAGGGETGAPEVKLNPVPRGHYHTDWIARRAVSHLRSLPAGAPFFCWVSFPDPHHPFDPPAAEVARRGTYHDVQLPPGHPGQRERIREILAQKPRHYLDWFEGRFTNPEGGPSAFRPGAMRDDQLREVLHMIRVENELIDEALGAIIAELAVLGTLDDTDIFYTSDHGDLQGDLGLLFKGPYHVPGLLRVPLVWRPAKSAALPPAVVREPVGHVDLAPTFLQIAGLLPAEEMQGSPLPTAGGSGRERAITTFDSQFAEVGMHLRTIYRDGWLCTEYLPSTRGRSFPFYWAIWGRGCQVPVYEGSEGELYNLNEDPWAWHNHWNDPSARRLRGELLGDLHDHLPRVRTPALKVASPT